jgi:hypothetical protein
MLTKVLNEMAGVKPTRRLTKVYRLNEADKLGHPILDGGTYKFWLVTGATKVSELLDVLVEVDVVGLSNIARGVDRSAPKKEQWELFPHSMKAQALKLAKQRIKDAQEEEDADV